MAETFASYSTTAPTTDRSTWPPPSRDGAGSLIFDQGRGLLIGLTGCTPERAADALVSTAAEMLLDTIATLPDPGVEAFVAELERAARDFSIPPRQSGGTAR